MLSNRFNRNSYHQRPTYEAFVPPFGEPDKFGFWFIIIMAVISILLIAYWLYLRSGLSIIP
jgi:hypothetical protein